MLTKQEDLVCYTYNAGGAAPSAFLPILVALPVTAEEVSKIVGFCNEHKISVVTRSQGSGLSVNAITESDYSIIISLQRMPAGETISNQPQNIHNTLLCNFFAGIPDHPNTSQQDSTLTFATGPKT